MLSPEHAFITARFIHFIAVMCLFGGSFFCCFLADPLIKQLLRKPLCGYLIISALFALISAAALWCIEAALMSNGWIDALNPAIWLAMLSTHFGQAWIGTLLMSSLATIVCGLANKKRLIVLFIFAIGQLMGTGMIGHAAMDTGWMGLFHQLCAICHLIAVGYWFGCLVPLGLCLFYIDSLAEMKMAVLLILRRFSRYGHIAVFAIFMTGIGNMLLIIPYPYTFDTPYIKLLLVKIAIVILLTFIAIYNRYFLLLRWFNVGTQAKLQYLIAAEWGLSLIVLLLVSYFATLMP